MNAVIDRHVGNVLLMISFVGRLAEIYKYFSSRAWCCLRSAYLRLCDKRWDMCCGYLLTFSFSVQWTRWTVSNAPPRTRPSAWTRWTRRRSSGPRWPAVADKSAGRSPSPVRSPHPGVFLATSSWSGLRAAEALICCQICLSSDILFCCHYQVLCKLTLVTRHLHNEPM